MRMQNVSLLLVTPRLTMSVNINLENCPRSRQRRTLVTSHAAFTLANTEQIAHVSLTRVLLLRIFGRYFATENKQSQVNIQRWSRSITPHSPDQSKYNDLCRFLFNQQSKLCACYEPEVMKEMPLMTTWIGQMCRIDSCGDVTSN